MFYLEKAAEALDKYYTDENVYVSKSECNCRLGNYEAADADADTGKFFSEAMILKLHNHFFVPFKIFLKG